MQDSDFLPGLEAPAETPPVQPLHPASERPASSPKTRFELHRQDCVEGMRILPDESVDIVVTSPPYNLGIGYQTYRDNLSSKAYLDWSLKWTGEVKRVLKADGSFFLNVGSAPANPWMPHELALQLRDLFVLQNTIHWIKSITVEPRDGAPLSVGHFKPINSKRFINDCHEYVFHFTKSGEVPVDRMAVGVPYVHKSNVSRWGHTEGKDKRCRGNNWFIPYETIMSRSRERPHPATFPVELARKCIALHGGNPGDITMLDPFLGIGHAAVAAGETGVARFIGFEIDQSYYEEAVARVGD